MDIRYVLEKSPKLHFGEENKNNIYKLIMMKVLNIPNNGININNILMLVSSSSNNVTVLKKMRPYLSTYDIKS